MYILELEDGDFYVGQTNDLKVRLAEHAMGAGAGHTKGMKPRLVWVNMATERESAKLMEARLQRAKERAKERNPERVRKLAADFDELVRMIKPDRTVGRVGERAAGLRSQDGQSVSPCAAYPWQPRGFMWMAGSLLE